MSDSFPETGEWQELSYFIGTCTCLPRCPAKDDSERHGWGSCDDPANVGCECEAGWEE